MCGIQRTNTYRPKTTNYLVYIVRCADKSLYAGITNDLKRRFKQHQNKKGGGYTQAHTVAKIVYTEQFENRSDALKRESEIKTWPRKKKLALIDLIKKQRQP